jgi:hypothetical protein
MKLNQLVAAPLLAAALILCSCQSDDDHSFADEAGDPPVNREYQIEGIPAETFYKQMLYKKEGDGPTPYRYLQTEWIFEEGTSDGNLYLRMNLFLMPTKDYAFVYEEAIVDETDEGFKVKKRLFKKAFTGKWVFREADLVIADVAVVSGVKNDGKPAASVRLNSDINVDGVRGLTWLMTYRGSADSMEKAMKHQREEAEMAWIYGRWKRLNNDKEIVTITPGDVRREYNRAINGAPCRYLHASNEFEAGGVVNLGRVRYNVSYKVKVVEPLEAPGPACAEFIAREKRELAQGGWTENFEFTRTGEKSIYSEDGGNYERQ